MTTRIPLFGSYGLMAVFGTDPTNGRLGRLATNMVGALPLKSYPCNLSIGTLGTLMCPIGVTILVRLTWVSSSIRYAWGPLPVPPTSRLCEMNPCWLLGAELSMLA